MKDPRLSRAIGESKKRGLRIGQLFENVRARHLERTKRDLFYLHDDELAAEIQTYLDDSRLPRHGFALDVLPTGLPPKYAAKRMKEFLGTIKYRTVKRKDGSIVFHVRVDDLRRTGCRSAKSNRS